MKILVAFSGGVDSAVAAALLRDQGHTVICGFMKNWSGDSGKSPCWIDERRDALQTAAQLGLPLQTFDFEDLYREHVVKYMIAEYGSGRTPNPDVVCNRTIKFSAFLEEAKKLGCDMIATGHYARVVNGENGVKLLCGVDTAKDQSYFLHTLTQEQLSKTLFPIGDFTKSKTRELAREMGLAIADKRSTRGICFVGKVSLPDFLREYIQSKPGNVVTASHEIVGTHEGVHNYTIGQRHGFGSPSIEPWYVIQKRVETNELVVAHEHDDARFVSRIPIEHVHFISGLYPTEQEFECDVVVRYHGVRVSSRIVLSHNTGELFFSIPQCGVAPGQFAVFYQGDECLGGGVIA